MTGVPLRVLRLIAGLQQGGAEESLRKLILATRDGGDPSLVVSLGRDGSLRGEIERAGATVVELGLSRVPSPGKLLALARLVRAWEPDVIEGWMVHANVVASLLRLVRPSARVVWNIRSSLALSAERPFTRLLTRLAVLFSNGADAIVYNSATAARQHEAIGYSPARTHVIPNGFDTDALLFTPEHRAAARARWHLPNAARIVGHVSRWHPDKDHATLLDTFVQVRAREPRARLVLAGAGLDAANGELMAALDRRALRDAVTLLGSVSSPAQLYPAFDVFVLTSTREGIPNVLGEALACGVPCVATDVGGCREILGDAAVVAVGDAEALANAVVGLLDAPEADRLRIATAGRRRIVESFGLARLGRRYLALYDSLVDARGAARHPLASLAANVEPDR